MDTVHALLVTSLLVTSAGQVTEDRECGDRESVVVSGGRRQPDGSVVAEDGNRFPIGCSWRTGPHDISGCPGNVKPCLAKCCPESQAMNELFVCAQRNQTRGKEHFDISKHQRIFVIPCYLGTNEASSKNDAFTVYDNGSLLVTHPDDDTERIVPAGEFCREDVETEDSSKTIYWLCDKEDDVEEEPPVSFLINSIGALISLPFLVATLVVYAVVPELRNLHGKCLVCHLACLSVAFTCLVLIQMGVDLLSTGGCIACALIFYFSFLASFFWLNVMCFDIWWTFSGYRSSIGPKDPRHKEKFVYYSLYAWGAAGVCLCVCATMQFKEDLPNSVLRPNFGEVSCWFEEERTKWAYFHGPIAALIICNLMFFTLTTLSLWKTKKLTSVLNEGEGSQINSNQQSNELQFKLYLKLFAVMGVSWTMEIISSAVKGPDYLWWGTDLANLLVGIPIFIIFVWKSKVRQLFLTKLNINVSYSPNTTAYELT